MRKFQWTPNFYVILVGPPGIVNKSTSSRTGMRLLEKVPGVKFGPPSITWQKLTDSLGQAVEYMKHTKADGTDEHLPMSCVTIQASELGTLLKPEDTSLIDVLVDLWDGQLTQWGHSTKTSGETTIKNPWINIIGCTTPSWLKENFPESMIGGGLTSRIIFVYGDKKQKLVAYPDELIHGADYHDLEVKLVADLNEIAKLSGEYKLTQAARIWGHNWYAHHWNAKRADHLASDRYGGYLARKQTHLHKLAIILSAAQSDQLIIDKEQLEMAEALLSGVEPHMLKVFESIGVTEESRHVHELIPFLRTYGWMTMDELWKKVMNLMSNQDFENAIRAALRAGLVSVIEKGGRKGLGLSP